MGGAKACRKEAGGLQYLHRLEGRQEERGGIEQTSIRQCEGGKRRRSPSETIPIGEGGVGEVSQCPATP